MKRLVKYIVLLLLILIGGTTLFAEDEVFIGDGDIAALHVYDSQGNRIEATSEQAQNIAEGWIIHNPDTPILLVTPRGTINVFEDSLLVTGDLVGNNPDLYLVSGKATFNTYDMEDGFLTVTTPVSRFTLHGDGEMLVITTDEEESVTTFTGRVESYNALTGAKREVNTFEKLFMQERMARLKFIEAGYYLTYATYPDMMLAKQIMQELSDKITAPTTPRAPMANIERIVLTPPPVEGVSITALAEKPSRIVSETSEFIPQRLQSLQVEVEPVKIPERVSQFSNIILAPPKDRIKITIRPMTPEIPSFSSVSQTVQVPPSPSSPQAEVKAEEIVVVTEIKDDEPVTIEMPLVDEMEDIDVVEEIEEPEVLTTTATIEEEAVQEAERETTTAAIEEEVVQEAETETTTAAIEEEGVQEPETEEEPIEEVSPSVTTRPTLAFSAEEAKVTGFFGLEVGYRFTFDGRNDDSLHHQLYLKPYFEKGLFSIRLQGFLETEDFSSYTNTAYPVPTSRLEMAAYAFSFIDKLRIGYSSSTFYLTMDRKFPITTELTSLYAPSLISDQNLAVLNQLSLGPFTLVTTFDDLYFGSLSDNDRQFGSSLLRFTPKSGYRMSVALGGLAVVDNSPSWSINTYPFLGLGFPVVDSRTTEFKFLLHASGYLPAYPTLDTDSFIDTSISSIFPNYLVGTGFSLKKDQLFSKILVSLTKGENHSLIANEFASFLVTSYSAAVEVLGDVRIQGKVWQARVLFNLPFSSSFAFANLTSPVSTSHQADYSQFSLSYTKERLQVGLGLAQLGIISNFSDVFAGNETALSLLRGPYSTSFLSLQYAFDPFTLQMKAQYPAQVTSYTNPVVSVRVSLNLDKQF
ncbi:hypothetical protein [uncultured Sphaerochaeta sp.]|uniref:hypothetical protein n=1 Tax=uncultured Sphaerochaeta sp. TaxID=886478 RepID=UPI0029C9F1DA|nr:hypothetical protein [uncultured Sphaerochaeta sp.]